MLYGQYIAIFSIIILIVLLIIYFYYNKNSNSNNKPKCNCKMCNAPNKEQFMPLSSYPSNPSEKSVFQQEALNFGIEGPVRPHHSSDAPQKNYGYVYLDSDINDPLKVIEQSERDKRGFLGSKASSNDMMGVY